ncbi:hypothetical protein CsSME_00042271 [Camellia sinensis var. sinensis]
MASSMSTATSSWPPRMCDCGFGHGVVKKSRSAKNPGRAYYVCPKTTLHLCCHSLMHLVMSSFICGCVA